MEKFLDFKSSMGHYGAGACVVWCFDDRFSPLLGELGKNYGNYDLVKVAGGAKALCYSAGPEKDLLLSQIKTSLRLHHAKKVILMLHRDCGAFGGSASFADSSAEAEAQQKNLLAARDFLKWELPEETELELYFADFDGLYKVA